MSISRSPALAPSFLHCTLSCIAPCHPPTSLDAGLCSLRRRSTSYIAINGVDPCSPTLCHTVPLEKEYLGRGYLMGTTKSIIKSALYAGIMSECSVVRHCDWLCFIFSLLFEPPPLCSKHVPFVDLFLNTHTYSST